MYQGTRVWEYHVLKSFPCRSRAHVDYFMEKSFSYGSSSHIYENTRCSNCSQTAWACSLQRAIEGARTRLESTAVCAFSKAGSTVALCSKCTGALTFFFESVRCPGKMPAFEIPVAKCLKSLRILYKFATYSHFVLTFEKFSIIFFRWIRPAPETLSLRGFCTN